MYYFINVYYNESFFLNIMGNLKIIVRELQFDQAKNWCHLKGQWKMENICLT